MTLSLRQYITGYSVTNFFGYPIRYCVTFAGALES